MKHGQISRRQFFKLSAFGIGSMALPSVALAAVATAPPEAAQAAAQKAARQATQLAIPQPSFNAIAATTTFGVPTDIAAGWDGTLWAIDASGAPHLYDPTQDVWLPHGPNLSAATWVGETYYWFLVQLYTDANGFPFTGVQVATAPFGGMVTPPQPLKTRFPNAPDSFNLSLSGAANVGGTLMLFNGGRYVPADGSIAPTALTSLSNWPTTPAWADGIIDAVHSDGSVNVLLFNGGEFLTANLQTKTVITPPAPISSYAPWQNRLPASWTTGIDAAFTRGDDVVIYKGTGLVTFSPTGSGIAPVQYIPTPNAGSWPVTWHPILNHAPGGRMGNLWAATKAGGAVQHDGESWIVRDKAGNAVTNVAVGRDSSVFLCGTGSQTLWQWNGAQWTTIATSGVGISQVAVGDAGHVFIRGIDNGVQKLGAGNTLAAVDLGANVPLPTHISANVDGTLWHCNSSNPNAQRLISESGGPSEAIPVKTGIVTGVHKVASTGFGAAHVLAQDSEGNPSVQRYDSPYVFKTAAAYDISNYGTIEHGLGLLYMLIEEGRINSQTSTYYVVAVDAQTGSEVARTAGLTTKRYGGLVFDPVNELVYVGTTPTDPNDIDTVCELMALDARTLATVWRYSNNLVAGIDGAPALNGSQLCFATRNPSIFMLSLANGRQSPAETWYWLPPISTSTGNNVRVATPAMGGGRVYLVLYLYEFSNLIVTITGYSMDAADGGNRQSNTLGEIINTAPIGSIFGDSTVFPPLLATTNLDPGIPDQQNVPTLFVNGGEVLYAWAQLPGNPVSTFKLSAGYISSGFAYDDGTRLGPPVNDGDTTNGRRRLWFGDSKGNLWSLIPDSIGSSKAVADHTPCQVEQNNQIYTTPVLYKDTQGGVTVLFGLFNLADSVLNLGVPSLYGYDPVNGNVASVPTGATQLLVMSKDTVNGVVYAGGVYFADLFFNTGQIPQVFGIRVDELPQAERDFVIESQLLQDPDENAANGDPDNSVPPSVARYQTHLTVVDDQKNPRPYEAIKIWCDTPAVITVDGQPFIVGPGDETFAAVKTGNDGALVITMDATDYFAPPLRVWASFMDPYERIVVNADTEFHQRAATAHANVNDDDPDKVNLMTASNYSGKSLFTDDEKNGDPSQPRQVSSSIQAADQGLGLSNTSSKAMYRKMMRALGVKHKNQRMRVTILEATAKAVEDTPDKYMAYTDLPGATHFPTNVPASRLATIAQPIGLSFSRPGGDMNQAPVYTPLAHTEARAQIDALEGEAWKPTDSTGSGGTGNKAPDFKRMGTFNIFQDFWNWLKRLFDKILKCLLSIAEDILAGIQYLVDGILKVFKAILKVLADIFPFLGSFFKMLEKLIDDVVEALSVLLHFGEIIWMHQWLADQFQGRVNDLTSAITGTIEPAINGFFEKGEAAVTGFFDKLRNDITGTSSDSSQPINGLKGMSATPHTAFSARPGSAGPNSNGSSHAVSCSYGIQKFKTGVKSATARSATSGAAVSRAAVPVDKLNPASHSADPVSDFFATFVARLTGDGDLAGVVSQLKADSSGLFSAGSAKQFFSTLLVTLLDLVETLIVGALAVANAFIDGFLVVVEDAIKAVMAVLTDEIQIPVLTWLYEKLFGEPLTLLNLATLIVAIPVTIIFRVVEGKYPSQANLPPASVFFAEMSSPVLSGPVQANHAEAAPEIVQRYIGLFAGILTMVQGVANAIGDAYGTGDPPAIVPKVSLGMGLMIEAFTFPLINSEPGDVTTDDWAEYGLGVAATLLGIGGIIYEGSDGNSTTPIDGTVQSVLTLILNVVLLATTITAFVDDGKTDAVTDIAFAAGLILCLPGMINPAKLFGDPAALVVSVVDFVALFAVGVLQIVGAFESTDDLIVIRPHRLFVPAVANGQPLSLPSLHP